MNRNQEISAFIINAFQKVDDIMYRLITKLESLTPAPTYAEKMSNKRRFSFALVKT